MYSVTVWLWECVCEFRPQLRNTL